MIHFFRQIWLNRHNPLFDPLDLLGKRMARYRVTTQNGSTVSARTTDYDGSGMMLMFQRNIESGDVKDGKLVPVIRSLVKRRGGKRQTSLCLSLEAAEALHAVLGKTIQDAHARQRRRQFRSQVTNAMLSILQEMPDRAHDAR